MAINCYNLGKTWEQCKLKNKVIFDLEYRVGGEKKFKHLEIDFVPNYCRKAFNSHLSMAEEVRRYWNKISDIETSLAVEKDKERIEELETEKKACIDYIMKFNEMDVIGERWKIIEMILVKNGYQEDEELMNFDWWDENVEPSDINTLVEQCVFKDVDKKKA